MRIYIYMIHELIVNSNIHQKYCFLMITENVTTTTRAIQQQIFCKTEFKRNCNLEQTCACLTCLVKCSLPAQFFKLSRFIIVCKN